MKGKKLISLMVSAVMLISMFSGITLNVSAAEDLDGKLENTVFDLTSLDASGVQALGFGDPTTYDSGSAVKHAPILASQKSRAETPVTLDATGIAKNKSWFVVEFKPSDCGAGKNYTDLWFVDADGQIRFGFCVAAPTDGFYVGDGERKCGAPLKTGSRLANHESTVVGTSKNSNSGAFLYINDETVVQMLIENHSKDGADYTENKYTIKIFKDDVLVSTETYKGIFNGIKNIGVYSDAPITASFGDLKIYAPEETLEEMPDIGIDYETEELTGFVTGADYTIAEGSGTAAAPDPAPADGKLSATKYIKDDSANALTITRKATSGGDSWPQTLTVPARPAAPAGVSATQPTGAGAQGSLDNVSADMEYKKTGDTSWTACGSTSVSVDQGTYQVRYKAVASTKFASQPTDEIEIKYDAAKEPQPQITVNYTAETLDGFTTGGEYTITADDVNDTETISEGTTLPIKDAYFGKTLSIVKKGNNSTTTDSPAQSLSIANRPAAPTAADFTVTFPSAEGKGKITGITADMEYSADNGNEWKTGGAEIEVDAGNVLVRKAAKAGVSFKSGNYTITVPDVTDVNAEHLKGNLVENTYAVQFDASKLEGSFKDQKIDDVPALEGWSSNWGGNNNGANSNKMNVNLMTVNGKQYFQFYGDTLTKDTGTTGDIYTPVYGEGKDWFAVEFVMSSSGTAVASFCHDVALIDKEKKPFYGFRFTSYNDGFFPGGGEASFDDNGTWKQSTTGNLTAYTGESGVKSSLFTNETSVMRIIVDNNIKYDGEAAYAVTCAIDKNGSGTFESLGTRYYKGTVSGFGGMKVGTLNHVKNDWGQNTRYGNMKIYTAASSAATPQIAISYEDEKLTGFEEGAYTVKIKDTEGEAAEITVTDRKADIKDEWLGKTIEIVKKGDGNNTFDSAAQTLEIKARPSTPSLTVNQPSAIGGKGSISGVNSTMEYSVNNGTDWTPCGTSIDNIEPGSTVLVRVKATSTSFKSNSASATISAFGAEPEAMPEIKIDFTNEKLTAFVEGGSYIIDTEPVSPTNNELDITNYIGKTISIVKKGNGTTTTDSAPQSLIVPARPAAPKNLQGVAPETADGKGSITGIDATMEYRLKTAENNGAWAAYPQDGVAPGEYEVRLKATATDFASAAATVTVGNYITSDPDDKDYSKRLFYANFDEGEIKAVDGKITNNSATVREDDGNKVANLSGSAHMAIAKTDGSPILKGLETAAIHMRAKATGSNKTDWYFFAAGSAAAPTGGAEKYIGAFNNSSGVINFERYKGGRGNTGITVNSAKNEWHDLDFLFNEKTMEIYVDGKFQKGQSHDDVKLSDILGTEDTQIFYIGKATWGSGEYMTGMVDDISVYGIAPIMDIENKSITDTLTLPKAADGAGYSVKWTSNNTNVISIDATGAATITQQENDTPVTLTAQITYGDITLSKDIPVTVQGKNALNVTVDTAVADNVKVSKTEAHMGDEINVTVTAPEGKVIKDVKAGDTSILTSGRKGAYKFSMPSTDVTVTAEFEEKKQTAVFHFEDNTADGIKYVQSGSAGSMEFAAGKTGNALKLTPSAKNGYYGQLDKFPLALSFSVGAWINPADMNTWWQRVFDFGIGEGNSIFVTTRGETPNSGTQGTYRVDAFGAGIDSSKTLTANEWAYITVTYDEASDTLTLYLNGKSVGTATCTKNIAEAYSGTANYIGKSQYSADALYSGLIDEMVIYNYAITADEIKALMGTEATPTPGATDTPKETATPGTTDTPKETATPGVTDTPKETATPGATDAPEGTLAPVVTPTPTATPAAKKKHSSGSNTTQATQKPAATQKPTAAPEGTTAPAVTAEPTTAADAPTTPSDSQNPSNVPGNDAFPFADVSSSEWFYDAVKSVFDSGLVSGISDNEFAPHATLTRGMLVTILGRMDGNQDTASLSSYNDVDPNAYYSPYVKWGEDAGILRGFEDGTFRPEDAVTREQVARIVKGYYDYKGESTMGDLATGLDYTDMGDISDWALDGVMFCAAKDIMTGRGNGMFDPKAVITRAEIASIVTRMK